jgi:hypothetical protein
MLPISIFYRITAADKPKDSLYLRNKNCGKSKYKIKKILYELFLYPIGVTALDKQKHLQRHGQRQTCCILLQFLGYLLYTYFILSITFLFIKFLQHENGMTTCNGT